MQLVSEHGSEIHEKLFSKLSAEKEKDKLAYDEKENGKQISKLRSELHEKLTSGESEQKICLI